MLSFMGSIRACMHLLMPSEKCAHGTSSACFVTAFRAPPLAHTSLLVPLLLLLPVLLQA